MGLESVTYISDLVATNPVGATDPKSQGDDHIRNIKLGLLNTFPSITGAVTATQADLNVIAAASPGTLPAVNGSAITNLNASNVASGTLADDRLSSNVMMKNADQTFAAQHVFGSHETGTELQRTDDTGYVWVQGGPGNSNSNGARLNLYGTNHATLAGNAALSTGTGGTLSLTGHAGITLNGVVDLNGEVDISSSVVVNSTATVNHASRPGLLLNRSGSSENEKLYEIVPGASSLVIRSRTDADATGSNLMVASRSGTTWTTVQWAQGDHSFAGGVTITGAATAGTAATSTSATLVAGQIHNRSANTTVNNLGAGRWVAVQNTSTSAITLSEGSGVTLELGGTTTTGNRTLGPKGFAFIYFRANNTATVQGSGVS